MNTEIELDDTNSTLIEMTTYEWVLKEKTELVRISNIPEDMDIEDDIEEIMADYLDENWDKSINTPCIGNTYGILYEYEGPAEIEQVGELSGDADKDAEYIRSWTKGYNGIEFNIR